MSEGRRLAASKIFFGASSSSTLRARARQSCTHARTRSPDIDDMIADQSNAAMYANAGSYTGRSGLFKYTDVSESRYLYDSVSISNAR